MKLSICFLLTAGVIQCLPQPGNHLARRMEMDDSSSVSPGTTTSTLSSGVKPEGKRNEIKEDTSWRKDYHPKERIVGLYPTRPIVPAPLDESTSDASLANDGSKSDSASNDFASVSLPKKDVKVQHHQNISERVNKEQVPKLRTEFVSKLPVPVRPDRHVGQTPKEEFSGMKYSNIRPARVANLRQPILIPTDGAGSTLVKSGGIVKNQEVLVTGTSLAKSKVATDVTDKKTEKAETLHHPNFRHEVDSSDPWWEKRKAAPAVPVLPGNEA